VIGNDLERIRFRYHGIFNFDRKKQVYSIIFQIEGIKGYWIKTSSKNLKKKKKKTQPKVWSSGCSVITGSYKLQGRRLNYHHPSPWTSTRTERRPLEEEEASGYEQKYNYIYFYSTGDFDCTWPRNYFSCPLCWINFISKHILNFSYR
jgi:hypothetical protein